MQKQSKPKFKDLKKNSLLSLIHQHRWKTVEVRMFSPLGITGLVRAIHFLHMNAARSCASKILGKAPVEYLPQITPERNLPSLVLTIPAVFDMPPTNNSILKGTISFALDKDSPEHFNFVPIVDSGYQLALDKSILWELLTTSISKTENYPKSSCNSPTCQHDIKPA